MTNLRLRDEPERLLIKTVSRLPFVLGGLLVVTGGLCAVVAFGPVGEALLYPPALRFGVGVLAGAAMGAGAWFCSHPPGTTLIVDRATQMVTLTCRGPARKSVEQYPAADVADVRVIKERDDQRDPVYRVELVLEDGSRVSLPLVHQHDREGCMRIAKHLWNALGLPRA